MSSTITAELDAIAQTLQATKNPANIRIAARIDAVSNTIEEGIKQANGRKATKGRQAIDNGTMVERGPRDERPPGSEETDEAAHEDSFTASNYHKVPIGSQSVSDAIGSGVADMLSNLDFSQATGGDEKHEINVQAGRAASWPFKDLKPADIAKFAAAGQWDKVARAASMVVKASKTAGDDVDSKEASDDADSKEASEVESKKTASKKPWPFKDLKPADLSRMASEGNWNDIARAARMAQGEMEVDEGKEGDYSTAELEETGDEEAVTPVDSDQTGDTLQFFGTEPPGAGPDSGHHGPTAGKLSERARWAREILRKADSDAPVVKDSPDALHSSEDGEDVERDQELGGMTESMKGRGASARTGSVDVHQPTFVPNHQADTWYGAAEYLGRKGRLLMASGEVDYKAITEQYRRALKAMSDYAEQEVSK